MKKKSLKKLKVNRRVLSKMQTRKIKGGCPTDDKSGLTVIWCP